MGDSVLRDINRERDKMERDIANLSRHYEEMARFVKQHLEQATIEWAKMVDSHPATKFLIVETTKVVNEQGYTMYGNSVEPIRITILSLSPAGTYNQLLQPTHSKSVVYTEYHGIKWEDLVDQPRFADVWPEIASMLEDCHIVVFGAEYARSAFQSVTTSKLLDDAFCLHNKCREYYGEFYDLNLEKVLSYQGIDKTRSELKDSCNRIQVLRQVVRNLAAGMPKKTQEPENSDDLGDHPF